MNLETNQGMGPLAVIAFVIGLQLGSALFLLPEQLMPYGAWGALSWLISGTGALSLSFIFAMLSKTDPAFGGPSVYIEKAFGKNAGFYSVWGYWFVSWFSSVPLLLLAISSVEALMGVSLGIPEKILLATVMLFGVTILNLYGAIISGWGEVVFAIFKVIPWVILPLIVFIYCPFPVPKWNTSVEPMHALGASSLLTFWGFVGLEASTTIMDVVRRPGKIIPFALCFGTAFVVLIYFINTWVSMGMMEGVGNPVRIVMQQLLGSAGGVMFSLIAAIMCLGTLNSWLLASGQMVSVALRTHVLRVNLPSHIDTTVFGVVLTSGLLWISTVLIQLSNSEHALGQVIELCCAIFIVIYFACIAALIRFIIRKELTVSWWTWLGIVVASGFSIWSLVAVSAYFWLVLAGVFITGYGLKTYCNRNQTER